MRKKVFLLIDYNQDVSDAVVAENIHELVSGEKPITKTSQLINNGNGASSFQTIAVADVKYETKQHAYDTYANKLEFEEASSNIVFKKEGTAIKLKTIQQPIAIAGEGSINMGRNSSASTLYGASGKHSVNISRDSLAAAPNSAVLGGEDNKVSASARGSVIIGGALNNVSAINGAVLSGFSNDARGLYSIVLGGTTNTAHGLNSIASGSGNIANGTSEFVTGSFADTETYDPFAPSDTPENRLLIIGNGTNQFIRSNAYILFRNGAQKWFPKALSTVTNAEKGFVMMDENARVHTHNGTQWNKLALTSEIIDSYTKGQAIETFVGRYNVQDIDATKTFTVSPIVPNPTLGGHAVNQAFLKEYVRKSSTIKVTETVLISPSDYGNNGRLTLFVDTTLGNVTINISAASITEGLTLKVIKTSSDANKVTIDPAFVETINGSTTKVLTTQYQKTTIESDGEKYYEL